MGVDICYWFDNNFSFSSLNELVCRLERFLSKKICIIHHTDNYENKTYWKYTSNKFEQIDENELRTVINKFTYKLDIEDENNSINDLSQNILDLLKDNKIEINFSFIKFKDLDITIREKTLDWNSWDISFGMRMHSFVRNITDSTKGFSEYDFKTLYLMDQIVRIFDSTKLLLIGDSCSELWGSIEDKLYEGFSLETAINESKTANIITSEMILTKNVKHLTEWEDIENTIFLLYFQDLYQYFIPCSFEEQFYEYEKENKNKQEDKPVEILELKKTCEGVTEKGEIKTCSLKIEKNLNDRYKCYIHNFDVDGNIIISKGGLYYQNEKMKSIIEKALSLDYTSLLPYFKYSKGAGHIYSIFYKRADFSFSFDLWINDNSDKSPVFFVDFIESVFKSAQSAKDEPENCIKLGDSYKIIGVRIKHNH